MSPLSGAVLLGVGSIALAAIVAAYMLSPRRRVLIVPFVRLWTAAARLEVVRRIAGRFRAPLSFFVHLAVAALLLAALGKSEWSSSVRQGRDIVVLMDASASMQGRDVYPSRFSVAKASLEQWAGTLAAPDRVLLVRVDGLPEAVAPWVANGMDLRPLLTALTATDCPGDWQAAASLAKAVLGGSVRPEVVLVSDDPSPALDALKAAGMPEGITTTALRVPVPEGAPDNLAVRSLSARRYPLDPSRVEILAEVENFSEKDVRANLVIEEESGVIIDVQILDIRGKTKLQKVLTGVAGVKTQVRARISVEDEFRDVLAVDDTQVVTLPERKLLRTLVVTPGNLYLEAALLSESRLDVVVVAPNAPPPDGAFDLTIVDGQSPSWVQGDRRILVAPQGSSSVVSLGKQVSDDDPQSPLGFDDVDATHPTLRGTALGDVNMTEAQILVPGPGDSVLGRSKRGPLLIEGARGDMRFIALGVDLRKSDLGLRATFPLWLMASIEHLTTTAQDDVGLTYSMGQPWPVPLPRGAVKGGESVTLVGPTQERQARTVEGDMAHVFARAVGAYRLELPDGREVRFSGQLRSDVESSLATSALGAVASPAPLAHAGSLPLWAVWAAAAMALLALEWLLFHRRWLQ